MPQIDRKNIDLRAQKIARSHVQRSRKQLRAAQGAEEKDKSWLTKAQREGYERRLLNDINRFKGRKKGKV